MAKGVMRRFKLREISAVDFPAQEGATFAIAKRNESAVDLPLYGKVSGLPDHVMVYAKRTFSQDERDSAAQSGAALPDGSFPIRNRADLRNAVRLVGHAKNPAKAKAHIISRARSLGASASLPDGWQVSKSIYACTANLTNQQAAAQFSKAVDAFMTEQADAGVENDAAVEKALQFANCAAEEIDRSVQSMAFVFSEIEKDAGIADKDGALQESFCQFKGHIQGITGDGIDNALVKAALSEAGFQITGGGALAKSGDDDMGFDLKKFLGLAATATDADIEKALADRDAGKVSKSALKMSASHLAYLAKARDPKAKKPMPEADCEKFMGAMSDAERDAYVAANPVGKAKKDDGDAEDAEDGGDDEDMEKRLVIDGNVIRKSVVGEATFNFMKAQQAEIIKLRDGTEIQTIEKRVATSLPQIGKAADIASLLHRIEKSGKDGKAIAKDVEKMFDGLNEVITKGGTAIFKERGSSGGAGGSEGGDPTLALDAIAKQIVADGKAKNIFKARTMARDQNPELVKREDEIRKARIKAA